ncbi:dihydrofolate reductase family protein [Nafulsella turpanensis]|uniref:dihydrofolate reductase family protein n=1 Tax=Nafulsella turpanensis TaxID=1265690 RepID=UPI00035C3AB8|nr:dihydrofolate reductase family protein [Nafulsella turpanensis]
MKNRKLIVYIATSLDGYIAKPGNDLSFLDRVQKKGEDYGYNNFISTVDCVILGRKTYDWVMGQVPEFPHTSKEIYVITRTDRPKEGNINFYSGSLKELVNRLKKEQGKNIFCDGGAEVINELLRLELIDEFIISIIPVLVGNGIKLFQDGRPEQGVELISVKQFDTGLIQLHYKTTKKKR